MFATKFVSKSTVSLVAILALPTTAYAQEADASASDNPAEIIVTAQKREQAINDVGMTIQAASGNTLDARGITGPADLSKLVPGFTYTESILVTPVYTLRGIGLYDATFGSVPAVAVYTDQVPRNYPIMSDGLGLDIERVEVLKGPQGTLFGQSSTGGAINYIVGKPTEHFEAGVNLSYERFGLLDASAFASGPLSGTLRARLAVRGVQGGAWQYSLSRPNEENGATRKLEGRLSLEWEPTDRIKLQANVTGARDRSDVQAGQYTGSIFNTYSAAALAVANSSAGTRNPYAVVNDALYKSIITPGSPNYDSSFLARQATLVDRLNSGGPFAAGARALLGTPIADGNARAADWTQGFLRRSKNNYIQGTLRADIELTDNITLTSVTAYADKTISYATDLDATAAQGVNVPIDGKVRAFNQELRIAGDYDNFHWIVGGNYDDAKTRQFNIFDLTDYSGNAVIPGIPPFTLNSLDYNSKLRTTAVFANAEFKITPNLTISGGVRYTKNKQSATHCSQDADGDDSVGANVVFSIFQNLLTGQNLPPVTGSQCFDLGDGFDGTTFGKAVLTPDSQVLTEDNVSFRLGLDYKFDGGTLVYATLSQGYKAGIFSAIGASSVSQYPPAVQEKVISYEAGFKAPLFDRAVQLDGAAFYYDYTNKQVRGRVADVTFGLLEKLINVPKSRVWGLEGQISSRPIDGLSISAGATYLNSEVTETFTQTIDGSKVYNSEGYTGDFKGASLPFTPKFSGNMDVEYRWSLNDRLSVFAGGTLVYQGKQNATFENRGLPAEHFVIDAYETVDLRAGVEAENGSWKVTAFGRNVFNKFYINSATSFLDTRYQMTGRPAIYGVALKLRYQ
jgi:iron complex outermembrane receptor protein